MNNLELTDINNYRLNEINKTRDYFNNEINERKDIIKKLNKYIVSFDYLDKIFIALSASFSTLSIASYATVVGLPVGIAGSSLTLIFTISKSSALNYSKTSHEEFSNIITAKNMYENIKENIKDMTESSSLERVKEEKSSTTESSSLKLTTL